MRCFGFLVSFFSDKYFPKNSLKNGFFQIFIFVSSAFGRKARPLFGQRFAEENVSYFYYVFWKKRFKFPKYFFFKFKPEIISVF